MGPDGHFSKASDGRDPPRLFKSRSFKKDSGDDRKLKKGGEWRSQEREIEIEIESGGKRGREGRRTAMFGVGLCDRKTSGVE